MSYHNTIFRQLLQICGRLDFQHIVDRYQGDYRVRTLTCWDQFIHLLFAQLGRRDSLRETVTGFDSMHSKLYHLGSSSVCRSTLSDANNKRSHLIYQDVFFRLLERVQRLAPKHKLKLNRKLFFMDATTIDLCLKLFPWARFRKAKAGIKLHTLIQADGALPVFMTITAADTHEAEEAKTFNIPTGSFLAIDRGYYDFSQFNSYTNKKIRFVTRSKKNIKYQVVQSLPADEKNGVMADELIAFTGHASRKKYPHQIRQIRFFDRENNKEYRFLTNDFDLDAMTIADIYKARWDIELFFKTIKQNLKIKRFFGTTANAVKTQIWIAMIVYLMTSFLKFSQKIKHSVQHIFRIISLNLFERKPIYELFQKSKNKPPENLKTMQMALF